MELEQLRTLSAVVDEGSFEGAAYALGVTPSAVSQRIKALESQVGRTVVRRTKPIIATESGEVVLRLARQVERLTADALDELGTSGHGTTVIPLVANADSLATWALPALAQVAEANGVRFDIRREDQEVSTGPLRQGAAMGAITSVSTPVPGCSVRKLGVMRYRPAASQRFIDRWFSEGVSNTALAEAPIVVFDRNDDLQYAWLRRRLHRRVSPPVNYIPESTTYAAAIALGLGWGLVPEIQEIPGLVRLSDDTMDVPLYWQQWKLGSPLLDAVAEALVAAADEQLHQQARLP